MQTAFDNFTLCRVQLGDTADYKSALLLLRYTNRTNFLQRFHTLRGKLPQNAVAG